MRLFCTKKDREAESAPKEKKRSGWDIINLLIAGILFCGCFFYIAVFEIEIYLLPACIVSNAILAFLHTLYREKKIPKLPVIIFRAIAVLSVILVIAAPYILFSFEYSKPMYPVKKYLYRGWQDCEYLPAALPEKCEDYRFITQGHAIAQDYHASSYLAFYTDKATLSEYEEYFSALGYALNDKQHIVGEDLDEYIDDLKAKGYDDQKIEYSIAADIYGIQGHVWQRIGKSYFGGIKDPKVYTSHYTSHYKGIVLDYETGLVIIWT